MSVNKKSDVEYILEVGLKHPNELHELHNDILSNYCKSIADKYEIKVGDVKKLIPNLANKSKYVVHYRNLQLYLSLEMKLTKIHRALQFKQSNWMKKHIDFNTQKRMNATNDSKKDFFKLMINSVVWKQWKI